MFITDENHFELRSLSIMEQHYQLVVESPTVSAVRTFRQSLLHIFITVEVAYFNIFSLREIKTSSVKCVYLSDVPKGHHFTILFIYLIYDTYICHKTSATHFIVVY